MIWWEDFRVGEQAELGRHTFTEAPIVAFGRQFDPQMEGGGLFGRKD